MADWGRKVRKYQQGTELQNLQAKVNAIMGDQFLWWNWKPYHPAVMRNWPLAMIHATRIYTAAITAEYAAKMEETE